ncbi:hypothetical protein LSAT2_012281 [Lamellibrachia satsuma]|nr:hypothetical protein LSAT2_012281 [Lamellibrachia satsuma]
MDRPKPVSGLQRARLDRFTIAHAPRRAHSVLTVFRRPFGRVPWNWRTDTRPATANCRTSGRTAPPARRIRLRLARGDKTSHTGLWLRWCVVAVILSCIVVLLSTVPFLLYRAVVSKSSTLPRNHTEDATTVTATTTSAMTVVTTAVATKRESEDVDITLKIVNRNFNDSLTDRTSPYFQDTATTFCREMTDMFAAVSDDMEQCDVTTFTRGSVVVHSALRFATSRTPAVVQATIVAQLKNSGGLLTNSSEFRADAESVSVGVSVTRERTHSSTRTSTRATTHATPVTTHRPVSFTVRYVPDKNTERDRDSGGSTAETTGIATEMDTSDVTGRTTLSSVRGRTVTQPSVRGRTVTQPSVRGRTVTQPSVRGRTVTQPSVRGRTVTRQSVFDRVTQRQPESEPATHTVSVGSSVTVSPSTQPPTEHSTTSTHWRMFTVIYNRHENNPTTTSQSNERTLTFAGDTGDSWTSIAPETKEGFDTTPKSDDTTTQGHATTMDDTSTSNDGSDSALDASSTATIDSRISTATFRSSFTTPFDDTTATTAVDDNPATTAVDDTPATTAVDDTPATTAVDDTPATTAVDDTPATIDDTPATTAVDDTPATTAVDDTPATTAVDDTPATTAVDDTPATTAVDDTPATTAVDDTPATTAADDTPATTTDRMRTISFLSPPPRPPQLPPGLQRIPELLVFCERFNVNDKPVQPSSGGIISRWRTWPTK